MTTIRIPTPMRTFTRNQAEVTASGATVREVLKDLDARFPGGASKCPLASSKTPSDDTVAFWKRTNDLTTGSVKCLLESFADERPPVAGRAAARISRKRS